MSTQSLRAAAAIVSADIHTKARVWRQGSRQLLTMLRLDGFQHTPSSLMLIVAVTGARCSREICEQFN